MTASRRSTSTKRKRRSSPTRARRSSAAEPRTKVTRLRRELDEALAQQEATSEVLRIISASPGELKPVFDSILANATRLCEAKFANLLLREGDDSYRIVAMHKAPSALVELWREREPLLVLRDNPNIPLARLIQTRNVVHVPDLTAEQAYIDRNPRMIGFVDRAGARTFLAAPMLKGNKLTGAIIIYRREVRPFTEKQIELVKSFATQAVIAIENARLFDDVKEALDYQRASSEILKVISSSVSNSQPVFDAIVASCARLFPGCQAGINALDENGRMRLRASVGIDAQALRKVFREVADKHAGGGLLLRGALAHYPDVERGDVPLPVREGARATNTKAVVFAPMVAERRSIGSLWIGRNAVGAFSEKELELLQTFADQAVIAIQNMRLFEEIQDKSRQLAEASQHKSQFLANMSHELRTPLNAILGYTELIIDNIYGDTPERMREVLHRIESNGKHLLGLINDVLDLSKIEAGQLVLTLADYSLEDVVRTVFGAVEPLAAEKKLAFKVELPPELPGGRGDERRLTQVLLNLVGNAIKFTDAGEVAITASSANGSFNVAVRDTGPALSPTDQEKLFQELQQAATSITKNKGGTGLGLAISKHIIEMHGGRIRVDSVLGGGSTFSFTLPITVKQQARPT